MSTYRARTGSTRRDFQRVSRRAVEQAARLLATWLPDGRRAGSEWIAKNPTRTDRNVGSFKVNLATGRWADFATGDRGGDLVALFAYLNRTSQSTALKKVEAELGRQ